MSFTLSMMNNADIPGLIVIKAASFGPEALQNLMFPPDKTAQSYNPWAEALYRESLTIDSTACFIKCCNATTGELMSSAIWNFYHSPEQFEASNAHESVTLNPPEGSNSEVWLKFLGVMKDARRRHMTGQAFYLLKLLVTHPQHQRKGAGTALIKYGISAADKTGIRCYLEASPDGSGLYQKYGFKKVEDIALDLHPWGVDDAWRGVVMIREVGGK
ncbi:MAG: hypothetical protein M1814_006321 [Vezdaea aestivalis]|nr:MAG: hypothetical protein M1814_006321 [Vezdaea aestivalis]